jgi:hypothetical protein
MGKVIEKRSRKGFMHGGTFYKTKILTDRKVANSALPTDYFFPELPEPNFLLYQVLAME